MDLALQLVIEMNQWIWSRFKDDLRDATPEEIELCEQSQLPCSSQYGK